MVPGVPGTQVFLGPWPARDPGGPGTRAYVGPWGCQGPETWSYLGFGSGPGVAKILAERPPRTLVHRLGPHGCVFWFCRLKLVRPADLSVCAGSTPLCYGAKVVYSGPRASPWAELEDGSTTTRYNVGLIQGRRVLPLPADERPDFAGMCPQNSGRPALGGGRRQRGGGPTPYFAVPKQAAKGGAELTLALSTSPGISWMGGG